ncbi:amino acid adenylation domain-containing protein [Pseudomonas sp. NPDC089741]|uniref:non-ribosomal peptide synthetase n=1 Tax=Pseudomonas sp. NPDC089741 TaxID=3364470 RepID=UPI0038273869
MNTMPLPDRSLPLLDTQVGLWVSEQVNQASTSHNIHVRLAIGGALDVAALQQAIDWLVQRHDNLRARFVLEGETPRQIISADRHTPLEQERIDAADLHARTDALLLQSMDITAGPLFRSVLLQSGAEQHVLLLIIHHLIFDGGSIEVLLRDLREAYVAFSQGTPAVPAALPFSYAGYVERQATVRTPAALDYWLKTLADRPPAKRFPCARLASGKTARRAADVVTQMQPAAAQQLRELTGPGTFTPFMVHMAICAMLLQRQTAVEDMVFGMPLSTRDGAETNDLTGLFVNVVALRLQLTAQRTFAQLLQHVRARILRAMMHRDLPYHELVSQLRAGRETGALFHVFLNHASVLRRPFQAGRCTFELLPTTNITAAFEMNLAIVETDTGFDTVFEFDDMRFDRTDIGALAEQYHHLLSAVLGNPDTEWRDLPAAPASSRPVHQWFETQVEQTPDAIAVVFEDSRLSYRELNARANQVARSLRDAGVTPGVLVGLCIERGPQMVVGILAVLKAGAAYLPIDPDNPDERIRFIVQDTGLGTLLTSSHLQPRFADFALNLMCLDNLAESAAHDTTNLNLSVALQDLAYCIYTSGSTGQPKGALNTHGGFANLVQWYVRDGLHMRNDDRVMLASSVGFDLTQKNILGPLCAGACLMIPQHSPAHAMGFMKALTAYRPTWLNCAPSAFRAFAGSARTASLRMLVLGGEPVDAALLEQLRGRPLTLVNSYGPTECSDVASWCSQDMQTLAQAAEMPLGQAIPGVQVFVLDENLQPVAIGEAGEIHIAGTGVGQGYLRRAALSAQTFIPNPYGPAGSRMYKSGDLGRYLSDGSLAFIGRIDFQVKVRGHRIELGEIESRLSACAAIREAVVMALEAGAGEKRLVAYLVAGDGHVIDGEQLANTLREDLPDYMVPDTWIALPQLPLNINGKLDRKALPPPAWRVQQKTAADGLALTPILRQPRIDVRSLIS